MLYYCTCLPCLAFVFFTVIAWLGQSVGQVKQVFGHADCLEQLRLGFESPLSLVSCPEDFLAHAPHCRHFKNLVAARPMFRLNNKQSFNQVVEVD